MPGGIGAPEILVILVIALLVLGPKRLPEAGKSLGKGIREFKESMSSANPFDDDDEDVKPRRRVDAGPAKSEKADEPPKVAVAEDASEAEDAFGANKS